MKGKRITERLDIRITYKPNGYFDEYDDYELDVTVNREMNKTTYNITPFGKQLKDMTIAELCREVKDVLYEVLGE